MNEFEKPKNTETGNPESEESIRREAPSSDPEKPSAPRLDFIPGGKQIERKSSSFPSASNAGQPESVEDRLLKSEVRGYQFEAERKLRALGGKVDKIRQLVESLRSKLPTYKISEFEYTIAKDEQALKALEEIVKLTNALLSDPSKLHTVVTRREELKESASKLNELLDDQLRAINSFNPQ